MTPKERVMLEIAALVPISDLRASELLALTDYAMAECAAVRPYITVADCDRATAWLDHEWPDEHPGTRAQQALSTLLAEVRRDAVEACAKVADSCVADECSPRFIAKRIRESATPFTSQEKK